MFRSRFTKLFLVAILSLSISHFPEVALGAVAEQMISTTELVDALSRTQAEAKIQSYLDREDLQKELKKLGISPTEVTQRMASLSVAELNQLSAQMDQARYGGDVFGILILVLVILLIIYLAKRI
jgi:hypothetical protein